jgi:hypothetical protein
VIVLSLKSKVAGGFQLSSGTGFDPEVTVPETTDWVNRTLPDCPATKATCGGPRVISSLVHGTRNFSPSGMGGP